MPELSSAEESKSELWQFAGARDENEYPVVWESEIESETGDHSALGDSSHTKDLESKRIDPPGKPCVSLLTLKFAIEKLGAETVHNPGLEAAQELIEREILERLGSETVNKLHIETVMKLAIEAAQRQPGPQGNFAPPLSPKTTRRKFLTSEVPADIRLALLWERERQSTASRAQQRRHYT